MPTSNDLMLLVSSALAGLAVLLAALWLAPVWDAIARKQLDDLTPHLRELSLDQTLLPRYLRWWGLAMVVAFFMIAFVLGQFFLAPAVVYLIYITPRLLLQRQIDRRKTLLRDQMVGAGITLANATRAGLSLAQGLESISKETPEPLAAEFRRIVHEYQRGRPLPEALRSAKERLNLDGFTLFASAILTCLERGGRVTEALERLSRSLQENQRLERKLEAETASGRKVVMILGAFPIVFLAGFYAMDPEGTGLLFQTLLGQAIVLLIAVMVYFSVRWAARILRPDF